MKSRDIVLAWHAAVNAGDVERLVDLSTEDVEVGGPRGSGRGQQLLREWFARAGVRLEPERVFEHGDSVVVEQRAMWPGSPPQVVASAFSVRDGKVERVVRYASVSEALQAMGLGGLLPGG
jgi:ketosteroid isomerase-like protein